MSMPEINLEDIDLRDALASVMASIALQEAAIAHVLNAEGEKIQAVVGMDDASVENLQSINDSVGDLTDNVSSLSGAIMRKLRTTMESLYPGQLPALNGTLILRLVDGNGLPIQADGAEFTLISNTAPGIQFTSTAAGTNARITGIPPDLYTLLQNQAPAGYLVDPFPHCVEVLSDGSIRFNGADAAIHPPSVTNLAEFTP